MKVLGSLVILALVGISVAEVAKFTYCQNTGEYLFVYFKDLVEILNLSTQDFLNCEITAKKN